LDGGVATVAVTFAVLEFSWRTPWGLSVLGVTLRAGLPTGLLRLSL
jgi:hypothetical protein